MTERREGRLAKWRHTFGFIQYNNQEIFVHLDNYYPGFIPEINQKVTFEIGPAAKAGMPNEAYRVRVVKTADQVLAEFNNNGAGLNVLNTVEDQAKGGAK
jgi:cold shock CspA family protein